MTEAEWLACEDPRAMISLLGLWPNLRKARCFARAALDPYLPDAFDGADGEHTEHVRGGLDRWADGPEAEAPRPGSLSAVVRELRVRHAPEFPTVVAQRLGFPNPPRGNWRPIDPRHPDRWLVRRIARLGPPERMSRLLREVFGNPFRPVAVVAAWLTSDVLALARDIYDERSFDHMPILADALQDAGCDNDEVLSHCRSEGPHVRGCWVVDLLLGKT
jgi:hypothetical protein